MTYHPEPIDNGHIELDENMADFLIERLAKNNHDLWAAGRIAEGWTYGPRRDEANKQTPLLVPYEDLPESEKKYDRDNAVQTLKTVVSFGGSVSAPKLDQAKSGSKLNAVLAEWRARKPGEFPLHKYQLLARQANGIGEPLVAFDIAMEGLNRWKTDVKLRQAKALALARAGSRHQARRILDELHREGNGDQETLGILARIYKDEWLEAGSPAALNQAYEAYLKAYESNPENYWTGINAATLAFAQGNPQAGPLARAVRDACRRKLDSGGGQKDYWLTATLAEAELVLGDPEGKAERLYREAVAQSGGDWGSVQSMRRNARIVSTRLDAVLKLPDVAVFTGHRIDKAGRTVPRFPSANEAAVRAAILERLRDRKIRIGYASAASGADLLFLEAVKELGGRTFIVLPSKPDQFEAESVGAGWQERFHAALDDAEDVTIASDHRLKEGSIGYDYANNILHGLAAMRARQDDTGLMHLAVWNGMPGDGAGGTASIVSEWRRCGRAVDVLNPSVPDAWTRLSPEPGPAPAPGADTRGAVMSMIFADAYHFSQLNEDQVPRFVDGLLEPVAKLAAQAARRPVFSNTWGDGLFFVFAGLRDAAHFALALKECVFRIDRAAAGLPDDMNLRIGIHAGPVYRFPDPLIHKENYIGSHVNRAARIEPITPPGEVYASDAFAALAALEIPGEFCFDYAGRKPLPKGFGTLPLYLLRKAQ